MKLLLTALLAISPLATAAIDPAERSKNIKQAIQDMRRMNALGLVPPTAPTKLPLRKETLEELSQSMKKINLQKPISKGKITHIPPHTGEIPEAQPRVFVKYPDEKPPQEAKSIAGRAETEISGIIDRVPPEDKWNPSQSLYDNFTNRKEHRPSKNSLDRLEESLKRREQSDPQK